MHNKTSSNVEEKSKMPKIKKLQKRIKKEFEGCEGCAVYVSLRDEYNIVCEFKRRKTTEVCPCRECLVKVNCSKWKDCNIRGKEFRFNCLEGI